jgi:hypothetical protein
MRVLVTTAATCLIVAAVFDDRRRAASVPPEAKSRARMNSEALRVDWLRLRVPRGWSVRAVSGGTVLATPVSSGWSREVWVAAAPFALPRTLDCEMSVSIPAGKYYMWISGFRRSRHGTRPRAAVPTVSRRDRVSSPSPGVDAQFSRRLRVGDRVITAEVSMDRDADIDVALAEANRVLRTLRMID